MKNARPWQDVTTIIYYKISQIIFFIDLLIEKTNKKNILKDNSK